MLKKIIAAGIVIAAIGAGIFVWLSTPETVDAAALPPHNPDKANGEILFHVGGCISCHQPPKDLANADPKLPSGGAALETPIGTLYPPNITPDKTTGIGNWTDVQFVNALKHGVAPDGQNYIPAFPYTSYAHMSTDDILDIKAYLMSLPPVAAPQHDVGLPFPWLLRRGVGVWKHLAMPAAADLPQGPAPDPQQSESWNRGAYLVNGPGHCAECHTPRNALLVGETDKYLQGGLHPNGKTKVPSLHNLIARGAFKDADDLAEGLKQGEDGGYTDMSRGGMSDVQSNLSKLPDIDVKAIADYLSSLK